MNDPFVYAYFALVFIIYKVSQFWTFLSMNLVTNKLCVYIVLKVKKLEREKRLEDIVDPKLNKNYNIQEVEMMIQVALLCTQSSPEDRPAMSEVVRMLEGEGLAERWEEWQHVEVNRRQEYERLQRRFDWGEDSVYNQDAIELSGGR
jgi:hypothetical protein